MQGNFEAKKHAYRQTQDGIVLSLVIHPNDVTPELAAAPLGTILVIGYATPEEKHEPEKERKPWHTLSRAQQAGILTKDARFREFLLTRVKGRDSDEPMSEDDAAAFVRVYCAVKSRSELDLDPYPRSEWDELATSYRQWAGLEPEQRG